MPFNIKRRGKLTYYYEGDEPVLSNLVVETLPDGERLDVAGFAVDEIDPTGAGDCFDAGFLCGLLEGMALDEAARLANACGALAVTAKGPMAGAMTRTDVERFMASSA